MASAAAGRAPVQRARVRHPALDGPGAAARPSRANTGCARPSAPGDAVPHRQPHGRIQHGPRTAHHRPVPEARAAPERRPEHFVAALDGPPTLEE
ncbi:hypothetical protein [Streptomyces noursei]|uniref:hypothetical protein n=1 Tax=Streptomyces noursei TaxID=1971 RepID=UPI0023B824BC|nr:hypothetical protein [Streptomyces noursei]